VSNPRASGDGSTLERSEGSDRPLARGLDKSVLHPHPCKILFLTVTIQNVPAMGKNVM